MPKKGKGKKKGGKGKEKKDDGPPPPKVSVEEDPLNDLSRQFYMVQIKDLEERVGRYQERCAGLQTSNEELQSKLAQQEEDQGQVIQFLKKKVGNTLKVNKVRERRGFLRASQPKTKTKNMYSYTMPNILQLPVCRPRTKL